MKKLKKIAAVALANVMMLGATITPATGVEAAMACPHCRLTGPVIYRAAIFCGKCGNMKGAIYYCQKCYMSFEDITPHVCR